MATSRNQQSRESLSPEQWQRAKELFDAAQGYDSSERTAFLDRACANDSQLRREVESLLAFHEDAKSFMESPASLASDASIAGELDLTGKTISHYRIVEKLGGGGMGVVYKAEDLRLSRFVALKFLPEALSTDAQALERFKREARAASALNHRHICTVYDVGEYERGPYIVMELLAGSTLRHRISGKPLSVNAVVEIGAQITDALAAAHAKGILHRDIKPANIFVSDENEVKLLDFGLAKVAEAGGLGAETASRPDLIATDETGGNQQHLTRTGLLLGTPAYMSPEQARGEPVDARTDIFSLGTVLYEMATGHPPFSGATNEELRKAVINRDPVVPRKLNPKVPAALERVIVKTLQKTAERRPQRAAELRADLVRLKAQIAGRWTRRTAVAALVILAALTSIAWRLGWFPRGMQAGQIRSLAVLPLENLSREPEQEYFADGMTDELITELAKVHALRVISRNSIMRYKGKHSPMSQIARDLNVDAVVEGTVARAGDQVRITAQLIEAPSDRHLWADKYEGVLENVLALQDEVARAIARQVRISLTPQEQDRLTGARPVNPEAQEAYLHGLYELRKQNSEGVEKSIGFFDRATTIDPNYALAYAALSDAYYDESSMIRAPLESMPKARAAAARAIELDDSIAQAHASLGYVKLTFDWDWPGAEQEFRRALELNSNLPVAHSGYALYLLTSRRSEEAVREAKVAQAVDPLVPVLKVSIPFLLWNAHHFDEAVQVGRATANYHGTALAAASLGLRDEAIANADRLVRATDNPVLLAQMAWVYAMSERQQQARTMLHTLEAKAQKHYVCAYNIAGVYASLGDSDQTFAWLDKAYRDRSD